ncbi:hypothetical protein BSLG_010728 [Batrachochytrium salamandrivorans]|nr:hypothetical protein BSLG_010728 [Batrachochytrium salamandrivorans]
MVTASLFLALALVSSAVVAQPGTNGLASLFACFKQQTTSEISIKSVYEWIPPSKTAPAPTSDRNSLKIGLLVGNLHAAVHVKNGQARYYSATIGHKEKLTKRSSTTPESMVEKSSEEAVRAAVDCLGVPFYHSIAPVMESYWTSDGNIPVWVFQLRDNPVTQWFEVRVDASTGKYYNHDLMSIINTTLCVVVSKESFKRGFTYKAVNLPNESPNDGFSTIVDPENIQASPKGWTEGFRTIGNNVEANAEGGRLFETTILGVFDGVFDPMLPPQTPKNIAMGVINAFYVANAFHDITYQYGFTEQAGNFQEDNSGKGGKGGDPVIINVQKSNGIDDAEFYTPSDGQPGVLDLYIYTATKPNRDTALDNTVVIHELTHGLTDRLTGGAQTKMCMKETESKGLSEGYSDIVAIILTAKLKDTRNTIRVIGEYVEGNARGIRDYPYATDMDVNPLTYKDVAGETNQHRLGTIWAVMLWEVYWNFVDADGFSANLHDATQKEGNIMFLQLLVGTLMIQPCKLTFISARDAMLAADKMYYGGVHEHLIRQGFTKRGLGSIS